MKDRNHITGTCLSNLPLRREWLCLRFLFQPHRTCSLLLCYDRLDLSRILLVLYPDSRLSIPADRKYTWILPLGADTYRRLHIRCRYGSAIP